MDLNHYTLAAYMADHPSTNAQRRLGLVEQSSILPLERVTKPLVEGF
jgi:hypothetical protein